jgi:glycine/serine hydroxymethyltransferase
VALGEAQTSDCKDYAHQTLINAKTLAEEMLKY